MLRFSFRHMVQRVGSVAVVCVLTGCTFHAPYRTEAVSTPCQAHEHPERCQDADIETGTTGYLLGFAEFDDQGAFWNREQVLIGNSSLLSRLEAEVAEKDMLMVVFVHGWKNNAEYTNGNVVTFRGVLDQLQVDENKSGKRRVVGVYVGWRGLSLFGGPLTELTFWDRKNTAEKVGHGAVTDFLRHIELVTSKRKGNHPNDRLVVVGHSFGGAIVHTALSQIMADRLVEAKESTAQDRRPGSFHPRAFGDLVLLINPAFEAQRYETLYEIDEAPHAPYVNQLPTLAILTSESDWATKYAFPIGRWFSTFWEKHKDSSEKSRNRRAVGHYDPYKTHLLFVSSKSEGGRKLEPEQAAGIVPYEQLRGMLPEVHRSWMAQTAQSPCDWEQHFKQTTLKHLCDYSEVPVNSPYLVVEVEKAIINGHNDIDNPLLLEFVREFVLSALP